MPPTTQSQQLGNFIRERRQARELSLAQLADALNEHITDGSTVEKGYLHRLESGSFRQPRARCLRRWARCSACAWLTATPWHRYRCRMAHPRSRCTYALPPTYPRKR